MRASAWSFCCRAFPTTMDRTFTREPDKTFPLAFIWYLSQQQEKELKQVSRKAQLLETWPSHLGQNKGRKDALSPELGGPTQMTPKGEVAQF